jgi:hypothetical protein
LGSLFLITRSALRLSRRDRRDAVRAWRWLVAARLALIWLPYGSVARLIARIPARRRISVEPSPDRYSLAVKRAARLVPAGCLPQAIAAHCLLRREGSISEIVFGVARDKHGGLEAHAWLWNGGRILVGGEKADRFIPLAPLLPGSGLVFQHPPDVEIQDLTPPSRAS